MERISTLAPRLRFTMQTRRSAEEHARRVYNVEPHVRLGWRPYRVKVTDCAISYRAFDGVREFTRWARSVGLRPVLSWRERGLAAGNLEEV